MSKSSGGGGGSGIGIGAVLAVVISWGINHSFWWALLHGIFGWCYIIYWALGFAGELP